MINAFLRWFSRTRLFLWFCRVVLANVNLRFWRYPKLPIADTYFQLVDILAKEPQGPYLYAFVSCDTRSLSGMMVRWVTKSDWSHAGIVAVTSNSYDVRLHHMMGEGLLNWHVLTLLKELDRFALLRFDLTSEDSLEVAKKRLQEIIAENPPYDFQQEVETKNKLYCSELVYRVLEDLPYRRNGELVKLAPHEELERLIVEPADIKKAASQVLYVYI